MIEIRGTLERFAYQNSDNHYAVGRVRVGRKGETITAVGYMAGVKEGETLDLKGKWVTHPKYGEQLKVDTFEVILPATASGIRKYLASGIVRGIGMHLAERIVDHFEGETFDIIENTPRRLEEVSGIGRAKAEKISEAWRQHHMVRRVMQFLQERGINVFHASAILKFYGNQALDILEKDPYTIARDIPGAGFQIADRIAIDSGIEKDHPERLKAALVYLLLSTEEEGHVYELKDALVEKCGKLTGAEIFKIETALTSLGEQKEIVTAETPAGTAVYLTYLHTAEKGVSSRIKALLSLPAPERTIDRDEIVSEVASRLAIKLSESQLGVVDAVLKERVVVITGGPGTGKTTLVRALCAVFEKLHQQIVLGAPTGRAARKLSQVTGRKASTLHKMLEYDPEEHFFRKNHANPLDLDVLVVDEASMVDILLMYRLLSAMPAAAMLVLVGDTFQLPSVGPGNVLADIINAGRVTTCLLTDIFRQAKESPIVLAAHAIRNGETPEMENGKSDRLSEFYFIEMADPDKIVDTVRTLCAERIPRAFPHVADIQVLTPMHRGRNGTINLNRELQAVMNPGVKAVNGKGTAFKTGDKVMHLKNNYEKDVFNGDIGIVHDIDQAAGELRVDFDGRLVTYDTLELDELTLAYAISVHKSQGSEYSAVVVVMTRRHYPLLQRKLLYTAVTRAKDLVILIGSKRAVEIALHNNRTDLRRSNLQERMKRL